ncbi:charged multivesicular body protein 6-A [Phlebotomus argentipes]|uniref:charged multivesicular body protein 6-A n=1 Tax=Phlebotomus argentipes TaxID=94469 RepID=UPI0028932112|nr:charged multivesicular body protein 6-A [Phlebotomus argentipes]
MGALFGKSKKPPSRITEQDKAVLQLKQQRDKLKQYQKRIELSLEKDRELAKKCLNTGRKERAKLLLRKKRYQEKLLANTDTQLENLEKLASDIEFAQVEIQVIEGLKTGNQALKSLHQILNIDEIEKIMDETREGVEKQQELDEILSGRLTEDDENAILEELDNLVALDDAAKAEEEIPEEDISEKLPDVPSDLPEREKAKRQKKEEPKVALMA